MKVEYMCHSGDDLLVCNAARTSFSKESEWESTNEDGENILSYKDRRLIHFLAREKHVLPFRHPTVTLRCQAPIFVARQLGKHQAGMSWSEESRRYIDSEPEFFWPDKWRKRAENVKQGSSDEEFPERFFDGYQIVTTQEVLQQHVDYTVGLYKELLTNGMAPEQARMILPQNMMITWVWTGTLLAWHHMLQLRLAPDTQKETRDFAKMVENIITPLYPVSMEALKEHD